jgi:hypothetical protein
MADFIVSLEFTHSSFLLSFLVSGINAKKNNNGDKEAPWNIPRLV